MPKTRPRTPTDLVRIVDRDDNPLGVMTLADYDAMYRRTYHERLRYWDQVANRERPCDGPPAPFSSRENPARSVRYV